MGRRTAALTTMMASARRALASATALAALGCGGGTAGSRSAQEFAGLWQAAAGDSPMICGGVQTTHPFASYLVRLSADASARLRRTVVDVNGDAVDPCTWQYLLSGSRAVLDGKQTCAVVTGPSVATTVWIDDTLTLSEDGQTLDEEGTFSDATGCATTAGVRHTRQSSGGGAGAGGAGGGS